MKLLNHLFRHAETNAEKLVYDEKQIKDAWNAYLATIQPKKQILQNLSSKQEIEKNITKLQKLLSLELVDVHCVDINDVDIHAALKNMEHEERIQRIQRLEDVMKFASSKYEYIEELLRQLFAILQKELSDADQLRSNSADEKVYPTIVIDLEHNFDVECEVIRLVGDVETFHSIFYELLHEERFVMRLDANQRKLLVNLSRYLPKVIAEHARNNPHPEKSYNVRSSLILDWARVVTSAIENAAYKNIEELHPYMNHEYVNGPRFADFCLEALIYVYNDANASTQVVGVTENDQNLLKINYGDMNVADPSNPSVEERAPRSRAQAFTTIGVKNLVPCFVKVYRDWYNHVYMMS